MESNGSNSETWQRFTWSAGRLARRSFLSTGSFLLVSVTPAIPSFPFHPPPPPPHLPLLLSSSTHVVQPMTPALLATHPSTRALANIFISYLLRALRCRAFHRKYKYIQNSGRSVSRIAAASVCPTAFYTVVTVYDLSSTVSNTNNSNASRNL